MTVLTGAIAIIKVNGDAIGKMSNVTIRDDISRIPVRGLSTIIPLEAPVVAWEGTISCDFYEIDFGKSEIKKAYRRDVDLAFSDVLGSGEESFEDQLVLDPDGVTVELYKKVSDVVDPNTGLIRPREQPYATVGKVLITGENITIPEGQVAGRNQSFMYLSPILRPGSAS